MTGLGGNLEFGGLLAALAAVLIPAFGSVGSGTYSLAAAHDASRSVLVELRSILAAVSGQVRGLQ
jgi:hypothetical protein